MAGSNGNSFSTYSPNDPNLIEKLSQKGVSISAPDNFLPLIRSGGNPS